MKYFIVDEKARDWLRKKTKTVAAFAAAGALAFGVGAGSTLGGSAGYGPILDWTEMAYAADDQGKGQEAGKVRVNITVGDHGSVDEKRENFSREVSSGGICTLAIQADDGYVIKTLKVNGEDLAEEERNAYLGKAEKELTLELLTEDTSVEIGFMAKPSEGETRYQVTTEAGIGGSITNGFDYFGGTEDNEVFWEADDGYVVDRVILDGEILADEAGKTKGSRSFTTGDHTLKVTFVESRQAVKGEAVRSAKSVTTEPVETVPAEETADTTGEESIEDGEADPGEPGNPEEVDDDGEPVDTSLPDAVDDEPQEDREADPEDSDGSADTSLPDTVDDQSADTSLPESAGQPDAKTGGASDDPSSPSDPEPAQADTHHSENKESTAPDKAQTENTQTDNTEKPSGPASGSGPKTGDAFPRTGAGLLIMSALLIWMLTGRRRA